MKSIKNLLMAAALLVAPLAFASESVKLDVAPIDTRDQESLQRGAKLFMNYCLSCHGASLMRYEQLTEIGLTEDQIKDNLMFAGQKLTDTMTVPMKSSEGKQWFGATPPDLSLVARSRGPDWIYTYLRSFYRDDSRPTGWNNTVFDKVGMPHVLWQLQGVQELSAEGVAGEKAHQGEAEHVPRKLKLVQGGTLTRVEGEKVDVSGYDRAVADLTNFMVFLGEPAKNARYTIGYIVLFYLIFVLVPITWLLKREYWKDVD